RDGGRPLREARIDPVERDGRPPVRDPRRARGLTGDLRRKGQRIRGCARVDDLAAGPRARGSPLLQVHAEGIRRAPRAGGGGVAGRLTRRGRAGSAFFLADETESWFDGPCWRRRAFDRGTI